MTIGGSDPCIARLELCILDSEQKQRVIADQCNGRVPFHHKSAALRGGLCLCIFDHQSTDADKTRVKRKAHCQPGSDSAGRLYIGLGMRKSRRHGRDGKTDCKGQRQDHRIDQELTAKID